MSIAKYMYMYYNKTIENDIKREDAHDLDCDKFCGPSRFPEGNYLRHNLLTMKKGWMTMYRDYENPYTLEKMLEKAKAALATDPFNVDLSETVDELKQRINFAWQDDEYDGY